MRNCAVNWCDKLCFFAFIFAVLLPIFVTWQGEVVNSRIVTETTLLYFHFYLCGRWNLITNWYQSWPLESRNVTILTIQGHVTSSFTWPFESQVVISCRYSIVTKSVSPTVVEIMGPKYIGVMTLTFLGHVTSSVTWPFEPQWVISYWWSVGPKSLSLTYSEILCPIHHVPIGTMLNRHCACAISRDMYPLCKI